MTDLRGRRASAAISRSLIPGKGEARASSPSDMLQSLTWEGRPQDLPALEHDRPSPPPEAEARAGLRPAPAEPPSLGRGEIGDLRSRWVRRCSGDLRGWRMAGQVPHGLTRFRGS
jgi:hypothetical protein